LDEPSIGLHQRDNQRLIDALCRLRDLGNTLIVVEHDEDMILSADHVVDIGPGAGRYGGNILFSGPVSKLKQSKKSVTADYLFGKSKLKTPKIRRNWTKSLVLTGANNNNIHDVSVEFPLNILTCVTGVSGSGKSTLIHSILKPALIKHTNRQSIKSPLFKSLSGLEQVDKVITIDQTPIGRTPRSNPATYTGVFTPIRDLMAQTKEAKIRGYKAGRFSFNVKGGRCEACQGDGSVKIEMHFLADVYVTCDVCNGKRYNRETLLVTFDNHTIADFLSMTVNQAMESCLKDIPAIHQKLSTLQDVGLGYIQLGQSATTLSGGEAQRIKLAKELSRPQTGNTIYLLDEPTTGLHFKDIQNLLAVLQRLVDMGNTVIVIEHNLDVIKTADYVIDLGPDGGNNGGTIVGFGTPENLAKIKASVTGQYLAPLLQ
jgi:excinuclease ABC subunit A